MPILETFNSELQFIEKNKINKKKQLKNFEFKKNIYFKIYYFLILKINIYSKILI